MSSQVKTTLSQKNASQAYEEQFVETDNVKLYCRVMGNGDPLIIMHGGPGLSMDYLLPGLEELAKTHLVIFYDQRGNGKSTCTIDYETINLKKFIDDLQTIQNYFNLPKVGLLGHSWGAYLAINYAAKYPDHINKLILLNSIPISFPNPPSSGDLGKQDPYEIMIDAIIKSEAFRDDNAEGMIKLYKDLFQFFFYDPKLVDKLNLERMSATQVKNSALIHKLFEENLFHKPHNLRHQLTQLNDIPTLIIHGNDHDIPESVAREIHSLIKGSSLIILNSGHFPYIERSKELFECIRKFTQTKI